MEKKSRFTFEKLQVTSNVTLELLYFCNTLKRFQVQSTTMGVPTY